MLKKLPRILPCLLFQDGGLVKTKQFANPTYIGDPINAVKIYNEMEADELIFLDIKASKNRFIDYKLIEEIAYEAFMPVSYGGGIKNLDEIDRIINIGIEKVSINSAAINNYKLIEQGAKKFGSQSIVISIDVKKNKQGTYEIYTKNASKKESIELIKFIEDVQNAGAGEILINSIDQDGIMNGYDLELLKLISQNSEVPIVACGGAGKLEDLKTAIEIGGADAVAVGSMFVYFGKLNGILINYPRRSKIKSIFGI